MKKTIGFAMVCSSLILVSQAMAFGGGSGGPRSNSPDYGSSNYGQPPAYGNPGSGGGFGGGPRSNYPDYNSGYGSAPNVNPGSGFGGGPYGQQPGPGYGGYQQGAPGGYNQYPQSQDEYDIPRNNRGQQYHPGQGGQGYGGYPQGPAPGYYGQPGHYPPPPGYRDDYRRDGDNKSSGFGPMNMMKNPMKSGPMNNFFGGGGD